MPSPTETFPRPECHDPVAHLKSRPGRSPWLFVSNPGNGGDALIVSGTLSEFRRHKLSWELAKKDTPFKGRRVILSGGGNLVPAYADIAKALGRALEEGAESVVLLPHTIRGNEALLGRLDARFTLFTREMKSFLHAKQAAPGAAVFAGHDMALALNPEVILNPKKYSLADSFLRFMRKISLPDTADSRMRAARDAVRRLIDTTPTPRTLHLLRNDCEAAGYERNSRALDLSDMLGFEENNRPGMAEIVTAEFLSAMLPFEEVVTDRLHGAIGAALLGKNVVMRDNSYGKNADVYGFSLADRFPCIRFEHTPSRARL